MGVLGAIWDMTDSLEGGVIRPWSTSMPRTLAFKVKNLVEKDQGNPVVVGFKVFRRRRAGVRIGSLKSLRFLTTMPESDHGVIILQTHGVTGPALPMCTRKVRTASFYRDRPTVFRMGESRKGLWPALTVDST